MALILGGLHYELGASQLRFHACVIFGGSGFIGNHLTRFIVRNDIAEKIYIADVVEPRLGFFSNSEKILYANIDVRNPIDSTALPCQVDIIVNLAAVHREPGHEPCEYFETNILGAENVCAWAEKVECHRIIFTSSISPYGPSEEVRDERSLPSPATAYGSSKLAAEKVHQIWQARDDASRRLVIVRPGVVFGPGEGGNVSRLIKAVLHRYFFYMGNRNTRKAGVYVKELCNAMWWVLQRQETSGEHVSLFNMSMNPGPSIQEYVNAVCKVAQVKRFVPGVPYKLLLIISYLIDSIARPLGVRHPFSPVRIKKLVHSNNIRPSYLAGNGYEYLYTLEEAFWDWRKDCPEEWQ